MELTWKTRRRLKWLGVLLVLLLIAGIFHASILRAAGAFLITEDQNATCQHTVILGGNSYERGLEGIRLIQEGHTQHLICTGGNVPSVLAALDTVLYEAEVTRQFMINEGVEGDRIRALTGSTSTLEEAHELLDYCKSNKIDSLMIVSSSFHLRRVRMVFNKVFDQSETTLLFHGAPPVDYELDAWWKSEGGLIMVNNEYVKYLYYLVRY